ncbi:helix-turn-helix domain-containing protein [Bradyrhizobium japonicum]|uniref:helix-turn-helix domain-containing protein n=1 Tax=Bradyrhizobium japonicum TaxID=375 RepID=UPI0027144BAC|nr:helix-turn-helix transcriptional regulator [Bradyrhizobium japonicum]WLB54835.1 helix-turn-helix transcriptional regulator [Bradyrhizobium japonicum]WLB63290.1 helix-turn-helix transcriptional regulator [Bradyrhizobium japonicum]
MTGPYRADTDRANRLHAARKAAGFRSAREAAVRFGWPPKTYQAHETANLFFDEAAGRAYAEAFGVSAGWLYHGRGKGPTIDQARQARFDLRTASALPPEKGLAGRLRAARRLAGYRSVGAAAAAVGTNRTTLSAHEAGQNLPPPEKTLEYARAFAVHPDWLISGAAPSGLPQPAEAALPAILRMHRESEGRFFAAFGELVRAQLPEFRSGKEDKHDRAVSEPKVPEGDKKVPEYSARALFLKLAGRPGALAATDWGVPPDRLVQLFGCQPAAAVLLVVPEGTRDFATGTRLLIDTATLVPREKQTVAVVTEDGGLRLAGGRSGTEMLSELPANHRIAGRVAAAFEPRP